MADESERIETTRRLLLRAVESLAVPGTSGTESVLAPQSSSQGIPPTHHAARERRTSSGPSVSGLQSVQSVVVERNRLFNFGIRRDNGKRPCKPVNQPKSKKKGLACGHMTLCVATTTAAKPLSSLQTANLMRAGLGKKQLTLFEGDDSCDLHSEILMAFPRLQDGGGYELLRVAESGLRTLHVIPQPSDGYSVTFLKDVLRQAKVYIRPMQRDLTLDPEPLSVPAGVSVGSLYACQYNLCMLNMAFPAFQDCPSESCIVCGVKIPLTQKMSLEILVT